MVRHLRGNTSKFVTKKRKQFVRQIKEVLNCTYLRGLHIVSFHQITFMGPVLARTWHLLKKYVPVFS